MHSFTVRQNHFAPRRAAWRREVIPARAVGKGITDVSSGDEIFVHSGWSEPNEPWVRSGRDPMLAEATRVRGDQTNCGSHCQVARAPAHHRLTKPPHLLQEQAASDMRCGSTTVPG
jgi:crotonyl-CoA carboxylase/reductase